MLQPVTPKYKFPVSTSGTLRRNQCPTCGLLFSSLQGFDAHRIPLAPKVAYPRECMRPEQLTTKGYASDSLGFWMEASGHSPFKALNLEDVG